MVQKDAMFLSCNIHKIVTYQETGKKEMTQVIDLKLLLMSIFSELSIG